MLMLVLLTSGSRVDLGIQCLGSGGRLVAEEEGVRGDSIGRLRAEDDAVCLETRDVEKRRNNWGSVRPRA